MNLTLVPFGYSVSEQQLVDVAQVASGKRCGCECPSCGVPLIARKGDRKVWHFAHDSQSGARKDVEKCRYSFFVSVRMMARQLIGDRLCIRLPGCEVVLSERVSSSANHVHVSELVTASREIVLEDVCVDTTLGSNKVDLAGSVDGYCLAVVFTHPGREDFGHFSTLNEKKSGVIGISLTKLNDRFTDVDASKGSYRDILSDFISHDVSAKRWIYHPRLLAAEQTARSRLAREVADAELLNKQQAEIDRRRLGFDDKFLKRKKSGVPTGKKEKRYEFICRLCNSTWSGFGNSQSACRKCGSSLLVSRIEIPEQ